MTSPTGRAVLIQAIDHPEAIVPFPRSFIGVEVQPRSSLTQIVGLIGFGMGLWAVLAICGVVR